MKILEVSSLITITQQSPIKQTHLAETDIVTKEPRENNADNSVHNTQKMLEALTDIDSHTDTTKDSPHDNPTESMTMDI